MKTSRITEYAVLALTACLLAQGARAQKPERMAEMLGPNVHLFSPSTPVEEMNRVINKVYAVQQRGEFSSERDAFLFLPGAYHLQLPVGFYTQVVGLGSTPDQVRLIGNVHADASLENNNATTTFWRGVEGFSVVPEGGTMQWAVSQAIPFRRMHVLGNLVLHQNHGWASGGWLSDSRIDGNVDSGSQQQWISRNSEWKSWTGSNWNMVFVGIDHPPAGNYPEPPYTRVATAPVVREKPFLHIDAAGNWKVRVPAVRRESTGVSWSGGETPGRDLALADFYIAHAGKDSAASMNAQLAAGRHLLLTPGIYDLDQPLLVQRAGTVVLGLGYATLRPVHGTAAIRTADVDGIDLAGVLIDAGETLSPVLVEIGPEGSHQRHAQNPITLHDLFFRVGGAGVGKAGVNLCVNSSDVLIDHTWIWRADHGDGVGWEKNVSRNGLVVNGDHVTALGLFVEHHQQYQVLWNGEYGQTYFYQSEIPYDPPTQAAYASPSGPDGWASYKVGDQVRHHEAWGLGIYSVFLSPHVRLSRAIEVPEQPDVRFHHIITVALGNLGEIGHVINNQGEKTSIEPRVTPHVVEFP